MIVYVLMFILGCYLVFGFLFFILIYKGVKQAAIQRRMKVNFHYKFTLLWYACLNWPKLLKFYIWSDAYWTKVTDENGKKHWVRQKSK